MDELGARLVEAAPGRPEGIGGVDGRQDVKAGEPGTQDTRVGLGEEQGDGRAAPRQDYARFLNLAEESLAETEYLLVLCRDLGYIGGEVTEPLLAEASEISRMRYALRAKVEQRGSDE